MELKKETIKNRETNRKGVCTSLQYLRGTKTINHKYDCKQTMIKPSDWLGKKLGLKSIINVSRYKKKKFARKKESIFNRIYIPQGV